MEVSMKKWLIALTTLVVLLVAGVAILFFSLNSLVEKAVNTEGPKITQTAVHLDNADISLFSGTGLFNGFTVGNPAGFTGHAASVKSMVVQVDTATVLDETIVIPLIDIDGPELVYELSKETSNFDVLMQNIKNYAESHEKKSEHAAASHSDAADSDKAGRKVNGPPHSITGGRMSHPWASVPATCTATACITEAAMSSRLTLRAIRFCTSVLLNTPQREAMG